MPGHDSKGSVEQAWAALGAELDATSKGTAQFVPDDCWATPEDGWAALAAQMDSAPNVRLPAPPPPPAATVCDHSKSATSAAEHSSRGGVMPFEDFKAAASNQAVPSFEDFKAALAAGSQVSQGDPLLAMRSRDPSTIENGWAALSAELESAAAAHNSVEDGWAALEAGLDARPPATWAELGGDDAAQRESDGIDCLSHGVSRSTTGIGAILAIEDPARVHAHGGVPVGALLVDEREAHLLRAELRTVAHDLGQRWQAVSVTRAPPADSGRLLLHLPPAIAQLFEEPGAQPGRISDLVASTHAVYLSGLRRRDRALLLRPSLRVEAYGSRAEWPGENNGCRFTFAEAFAGIGGFRLGLGSRLRGRCVFANDLDEAAASTYRLNFREGEGGEETLIAADLVHIPAEDIPDHDILTGGFPCQPFSIRGAQGGRSTESGDWRGMLYLELVRLLRAKRPRAFIFENVVGLILLEGGARTEAPNRASAFTPGASCNGHRTRRNRRLPKAL